MNHIILSAKVDLCLVCQVSLVVLFMVGVIVYKLLVIHPLYKNPNFQDYASSIVSVTGSIMNLIIIMILSKVGFPKTMLDIFFLPFSVNIELVKMTMFG